MTDGCPYVERDPTPADEEATASRPLRVAIAGKGGSGKTTIAGTMARVLCGRGRPVLAVDADTNPNLALTLGLSGGDEIAALPGDLLERRTLPDGTVRSELGVPVRDIIRRHSGYATEGLRLLVMGRVDHAGAG